jgi:hypothetical protein
VDSSPDNAGASQNCQMIRRPASDTGRCNDSEPAYESLSRRIHQLQPDGYGLGCDADPHAHVRKTPGSTDVVDQRGHGESLRRNRGEVAGAKLGTYLVERFKVNVGTISMVPSPASRALADGKICRRSRPPRWGGGVVVVRGQESWLHGEGLQCVRSVNADRGGRW